MKHDWRFLRSNTIDESDFSKPINMPWGEARKNVKIVMLTRNKHRFFKHISSMSNDKPKRRKVTFYLSNTDAAKFDRKREQSGLNISEYIRACTLDKDAAEQKLLAKILAEIGLLKVDLKSRDLLSDDVIRELKLNRTVLMSLMRRRT